MKKNVLNVQNDSVTVDNTISLKRFPPKLRRLAKFLLESEHPMTITEACKALNLNRSSINVMIHRAKEKGFNFNEFIKEAASSILHLERIAVNKALLERAVSGSYNHQKLYYQLQGELQEQQSTTVNLAIGINLAEARPQGVQDGLGVIDVKTKVPKKK